MTKLATLYDAEMELQLQDSKGLLQVTAYGPGWFEVNGERHETALQLSNESCQPLAPAPSSIAELDVSVLKEVIAAAPAVVLFGTGVSFATAPPGHVSLLADAGIGAEAMDSAAAARTFNLLVGEDRSVVAFLLPLG